MNDKIIKFPIQRVNPKKKICVNCFHISIFNALGLKGRCKLTNDTVELNWKWCWYGWRPNYD